MDIEAMLAEAKSELAVAQKRVTALNGIITGLNSLATDGTAPTAATVAPQAAQPASFSMVTYPKPKDAVYQALRSHPDQPMQAKQVIRIVRDQGTFDHELKSGENSYGSALRRLSLDDDVPIIRQDDGLYVYRADLGARYNAAITEEQGAALLNKSEVSTS